MILDKFGQAFMSLIQNNGITAVVVMVIVVHGFTSKFLAWMNKKDAETDNGKQQVESKQPKENEDNQDIKEHPENDSESEWPMIPYNQTEYSENEMKVRSQDFFDQMNKRRSVRFFSDREVPFEVIENCIKTAGTSPSGANLQPWKYVVVKDSVVKGKIRKIVEEEEEINYKKRMSKTWVADLKKFCTNWEKPYLETAPYLILVFKESYGLNENLERITNYYVEESIGLSCGLLLAAIQNAGLVTLTSTPMNCGPKIRTMLNRRSNEKLFLLLPVGYASDDCKVPSIKRKNIEDFIAVV